MDYKVGLPITIQYVALKKTLSLADLTLKTYNAAEALVDTIVMTEVGGGTYKAAFTPATTGQWRIDVSSVANGDSAGKIYEIESYNLGDVNSNVSTVSGKVDTVTADVVAVKTELDAVQTKVNTIDTKADTNATAVAAVKTELDAVQTTVNSTSTKADTIITKVDAVKSELDTVNTNVSAVKTKTDNLPADTAGTLTAIQSTINAVSAQINIGGYIL